MKKNRKTYILTVRQLSAYLVGNSKQVSLDVALWCLYGLGALIYANILWKFLPVNLGFHTVDYYFSSCAYGYHLENITVLKIFWHANLLLRIN